MFQIREMRRNIKNCMMGNLHCSTNKIPRGLPRSYSFGIGWYLPTNTQATLNANVLR